MHPFGLPHIVLFGGSFNPIHRGHLEIAQQLASMPEVDQVLLIPAAQSPFKADVPLLPAELRYRMACAGVGGMERVAVLDCEINRPPPSYTADTVRDLRHLLPEAQLWLAMGMDVFATFRDWHQPDVLLEHAGLLVFDRTGSGSHPAPLKPSALPDSWSHRIHKDTAGHLLDERGRRVVWWADLQIPSVSSSAVLKDRDLGHVPAGARALLAAYWQMSVPAAAP